MKSIKYFLFSLVFVMAVSCDQEVIELQQPEPPAIDTSCEDAVAGTAVFTKFVALGSSYTAGFQGGALFNAGQNTSLGQILATQFECVGGGDFNQPSIKSDYGYNIFVTPNPPADNQIRGRYVLQGTPPSPTPWKFALGDLTAAPNPVANPAFMYTGSAGAVPSNQLNNFSVQAVFLGQAIALTETGDWTKADMDPGTPGAQPHPYFNPFYARFASNPGTSRMLTDAIGSLTNGGTFFLYWLGMDDVLLHAAFGGDPAKAPLTPLDFVDAQNPGFKYLYNAGINGILANPTLKGVIANYPDIFTMPHFTSVPWNAIAFTAADETKIGQINGAYAPYNGGLDAALAGSFPGLTAEEVAKRKISFEVGANGIVIEDQSLTDLSAVGLPRIRQATSADKFPLSTGAILGKEATPGNPATVWGVTKALTDQYALVPVEIQEINDRLIAFNAHIKSVADANPTRLAFADVNKAMKDFVTAKAYILNGVMITPSLAPPTGIYSEEGLHPNSRGYAFISRTFIEAINTKFESTIPLTNIGLYQGTGLPINP